MPFEENMKVMKSILSFVLILIELEIALWLWSYSCFTSGLYL